jgi:hypothetical protein
MEKDSDVSSQVKSRTGCAIKLIQTGGFTNESIPSWPVHAELSWTVVASPLLIVSAPLLGPCLQ